MWHEIRHARQRLSESGLQRVDVDVCARRTGVPSLLSKLP